MKPRKDDPAEVRRRVGQRIAEARRARGRTQEQLAEDLEVSGRYVQAVEAGDENLTIETLVKLGNSLGVAVEDLFARDVTARRGR